MNKVERSRLADHCIGLFTKVLAPEITSNGCIIVRTPDDIVYEDDVTTHHLVDLCLLLDRSLFDDIVNNAFLWYLNKSRDSANPFFVTTAAITGYLDRTLEDSLITEKLLRNTRKSGLIEIFAGFLDGGSIFSTLWAVKILLAINPDKYMSNILAAMQAIWDRWEDVHRTSFKGFYYELLCQLGKRQDLPDCNEIRDEILASQEASGLWDHSILYSCYIVGNLLSDRDSLSVVRPNIERTLSYIFDLDNTVERVPPILAELKKTNVESAYLQTVIRAIFSAVKFLRISSKDDPTNRMISALIGTWPVVYEAANQMNIRLKEMETQYGSIAAKFGHFNSIIKPILENSPYERNVFIMMAFRKHRDDRYSDIEKAIKKKLQKHGFRGWLASDITIAEQLWDNVRAYMIACKYGIAVFTRLEVQPADDQTQPPEIRVEFNPNVSLELGFLLSRGKDILILKDSALPKLQSDLMGHLYEEFDLNLVRRQIPTIVDKWVNNVLLMTKSSEDKK